MALLEVQDVSKLFGGVEALSAVSLGVEKGEVHAVIGPNGAGKTTLFNCISRIYSPDTGTIRYDGNDITNLPPHQIPKRGIARTFQNLELFRNATVLDNLLLGQYLQQNSGVFAEALFLPSVRSQELEARRKVEEIIDFLDLQAFRDKIVAHLPLGVQKSVELGRALALNPSLILLDEPSSGLNPEETEDLCFWIEDINEALGITVVLVEHDMWLVNEVSDKVTVLDFGVAMASGTPEEVLQNPDVVRAYLGAED